MLPVTRRRKVWKWHGHGTSHSYWIWEKKPKLYFLIFFERGIWVMTMSIYIMCMRTGERERETDRQKDFLVSYCTLDPQTCTMSKAYMCTGSSLEERRETPVLSRKLYMWNLCSTPEHGTRNFGFHFASKLIIGAQWELSRFLCTEVHADQGQSEIQKSAQDAPSWVFLTRWTIWYDYWRDI